MRRTTLIRPLFTFAAAVIVTAASAGVTVQRAAASTAVLADGSVRYDYGRKPLPVLICKPQFVCDIVLDSGETVMNMAIGDAARWIIAGGKSGVNGTTPHIFVKPTQIDLETNLVITTTKRVYDVTLRSAVSAQHPHISFFYPDEDAAAKSAAAEHERNAINAVLAGTPQLPVERADSKYKVTGDSGLLPDKVFNDGARTFVQWKMLPAELPDVFVINKDGAPVTANFRVVGSTYVVDSVEANVDLVLVAINDKHGRPERRVQIRHQ
jgi:P-type conjugative transfer protein TrbG